MKKEERRRPEKNYLNFLSEAHLARLGKERRERRGGSLLLSKKNSILPIEDSRRSIKSPRF